MIEIKVNCKGTHYFSLDKLFILQDTDNFVLKELSEDNFEKLKNRIERKGFWFPFFVWHCKEEDKWYYTDGTQRHKVLMWMRESGNYKLPDKFPCVEIFAKDKKEAAEAILTQSTAYGKITEEGLYGFLHEYNLDLDFIDLKNELELPDIDLEQFEEGYLIDDVDNNEDEIPDVDEKNVICKTGDLWLLDKHRLLCGDATKKEDVERLMGGKKADIGLSDPPYGIDVVGSSPRLQEKKKLGSIGGSVLAITGKYKPVSGDEDTDTARKSYFLLKGRVEDFIIWGGNYFTDFLPPSKGWIVWNKKNNDTTFADAELAWTSFDKSIRLYEYLWSGMRRAGDRDLEGKYRFHPTQKPVGLLIEILREWGTNSNIIVDPFLGSGSTLIACEKTNRICYGMEIDPYYCDVIIKRYINFVGSDKDIFLIRDNKQLTYKEVENAN